MPKFRLKAISVSKNFLNPKAQERAIENFLNAAAEDFRVDFLVTTQTWKDKPAFTIEKNPGERIVATNNKIYKFVSGGTRVRYATMTPDFVAKTTPDTIGSGPGRGGKAFVNRNKPKPGIKARNFPAAIKKKWGPRMTKLCLQMIKAELNRR